jgi:hypothetical protein
VKLPEGRARRSLATMGAASLAALVAAGFYLKPSITNRQPAAVPSAKPASGWLLTGASFADSAHGTVQLRRYPPSGPGRQSTVSFLTWDGGKTWHGVASGRLGVALARFVDSGIAVLQVGDGLGETTTQVSVDGGRTWRKLTDPGPNSRAGLPVFLDADHAWWVDHSAIPGTPVAIWRTADGGRSWQRLAGSGLVLNGFADEVVFIDDLHAALVSRSPEGRVFSLFVTADGGKTWHAVETPAVQLLDARLLSFTLIKHGRRLLAWLIAVPAAILSSSGVVTFPPGTRTEFRTFVSVSDDGGETWSPPQKGPSVVMPPVFLPVPQRDDRGDLLLLDDRRLWISPDDGASWTATAVKVTSGLRPGLLVGAGSGALFALAQKTGPAGTPGQASRLLLLRSTDGGAHWSPVALPQP